MSRAKRLLKSCEWAIASALLVDRGNVRWGKWRSVIPVGVFPWGEAHNLLLVCVCVCVFIKLHITTQSGPVILVILCHSH